MSSLSSPSNARPREALRRVLVLLNVLGGNRFPVALDDAWRDVTGITGVPVSRRTVERDLQLVESLSLVERTNLGWRLAPGSSNLAKVARRLCHE